MTLITTYPSPFCQALADRITNPDVYICGSSFGDLILQRFCGSQVTRKLCTIRNREEFGSPTLCTSTLKTFVGFERVIIRLLCPRQMTYKLLQEALSQNRRKGSWPSMEMRDGGLATEMLWWFGRRRNEIRTDLEPTLGPGEINDEGRDLCVDFHPLYHSST